jgi:sulfur transfer protein SufE
VWLENLFLLIAASKLLLLLTLKLKREKKKIENQKGKIYFHLARKSKIMAVAEADKNIVDGLFNVWECNVGTKIVI